MIWKKLIAARPASPGRAACFHYGTDFLPKFLFVCLFVCLFVYLFVCLFVRTNDIEGNPKSFDLQENSLYSLIMITNI